MHGLLRRSTLVVAVVSLALVAALQAAAGPPGGDYTVTPLVSDIPGVAPVTDPDLVNGWGLAAQRDEPVVGRRQRPRPEHEQVDALHRRRRKVALTVSVPGGPTGTVFAGGHGQLPDRDGDRARARRRVLHLRD